jgi:hypothetical protein
VVRRSGLTDFFALEREMSRAMLLEEEHGDKEWLAEQVSARQKQLGDARAAS